MNDEDLPAIAEKAMNSILCYHDVNHTGIDSAHQRILKDRIEELLPLRPIAADPNAANVEIVCDAAMSCLDLWNSEHRGNPVEEKWMYIGVQSLVCVDLKPSLVQGRVPRLPVPDATGEARPATTNDNPGADSHGTPRHDDAEDHSGSGSRATTVYGSPIALTLALKRDSSTQDEPSSNVDSDGDPETVPRPRKRRSNGPQVANGKEAWGDEDISNLIKWKAQGKTHKEIGAILGRTEPACAIRHSIVLKQDRWIDFARVYREKRAAGEVSDEEGELTKEDKKIAPVGDEEVDSQATELIETPQQLEEADHKDENSEDEDPKDDDYKE